MAKSSRTHTCACGEKITISFDDADTYSEHNKMTKHGWGLACDAYVCNRWPVCIGYDPTDMKEPPETEEKLDFEIPTATEVERRLLGVFEKIDRGSQEQQNSGLEDAVKITQRYRQLSVWLIEDKKSLSRYYLGAALGAATILLFNEVFSKSFNFEIIVGSVALILYLISIVYTSVKKRYNVVREIRIKLSKMLESK